VHGYISGIKIALTLRRARTDMEDVATNYAGARNRTARLQCGVLAEAGGHGL